jgi:hypothetical protein
MRGVIVDSGAPDRPPRPVDIRSSSTGSELLHTKPDAPRSVAAATIEAVRPRSSSVTKGGTLTNSGLAVCGRSAARSSATCSPACSHPALGLLAFTSNPSTSGSRSSSVATASSVASSAIETKRGAVRRMRASARATASAPGFGRPIAFTSARRAGSRATLGAGLPRRGARVTVPPTTNPNPREPSASSRVQPLSKPAASPIGLRSGIPASVVTSEGSSTAPPIRLHGSGRPSRRRATRCDRSGSIEKNARRPTASYQPIDRPY